MNLRRFLLATGLISALAVLWNGLVHLVLFRAANEAIRELRRTDLPAAPWLSLLLTVALASFFVLGYSRSARTGSVREGAGYGFFVGLAIALVVDLNQYLLYPLPFGLVARWFIAGVAEFTVYGIVLSLFIPFRRP